MTLFGWAHILLMVYLGPRRNIGLRRQIDTTWTFFSRRLLVMPYLSGKHRSLFVVLGANNINDYMKHGFTGTKPCILHIVPYATSARIQTHAYNEVSLRIRTWLNALWPTANGMMTSGRRHLHTDPCPWQGHLVRFIFIGFWLCTGKPTHAFFYYQSTILHRVQMPVFVF